MIDHAALLTKCSWPDFGSAQVQGSHEVQQLDNFNNGEHSPNFKIELTSIISIHLHLGNV